MPSTSGANFQSELSRFDEQAHLGYRVKDISPLYGEQLLKTVRHALDDRSLADMGLGRTPGPMGFTFERWPGCTSAKTHRKEVEK